MLVGNVVDVVAHRRALVIDGQGKGARSRTGCVEGGDGSVRAADESMRAVAIVPITRNLPRGVDALDMRSDGSFRIELHVLRRRGRGSGERCRGGCGAEKNGACMRRSEERR